MDILTAHKLHQEGQLDKAEAGYKKILKSNPKNFNALHQLGILAYQTKRLLMAEENVKKALRVVPNNVDALNTLGVIYTAMKKYEEARHNFKKAIAINPKDVKSFNNLGTTYQHEFKYLAAIDCYKEAAKLDPQFIMVFNNLGLCYSEIGDLENAEIYYQKAYDLNPSSDDTAFNLALLYLMKGDYEIGFKFHEKRFGGKGSLELGKTAKRLKELESYTRWDGGPLNGKTFLLITEQGYGDNFMMMRYIPLIKGLGADKIIVYCDEPVKRVYEHIQEVDEVITTSLPLPLGRFDVYEMIMSLPLRFKTSIDSIPVYTYPKIESTKFANKFLGAKPNIGIAWFGNRANINDATRSIELEKLAPILNYKNAEFVSLQKGGRKEIEELQANVIDFIDECEDFFDTAILINNLNLVITVDTAIAHLAGLLGKPVWLLNRFTSEWRWMKDKDICGWYPTMKIFRQQTQNDWSVPINQVVNELSK